MGKYKYIAYLMIHNSPVYICEGDNKAKVYICEGDNKVKVLSGAKEITKGLASPGDKIEITLRKRGCFEDLVIVREPYSKKFRQQK